MSGYPYRSGYVGQIHADGWGWDDCAEACGVRLVREAGKLDPAGDHLAQIAQMREDMTGERDSPSNGYTSSDQIAHGLAIYGINAHWSGSYAEAHNAPWSLVVINYVIELAGGGYAYSESALAGATHVCLWMPDGAVDDPLAQIGGYGDVHWNYASLQAHFLGAMIVDSQVGVPWPPPAPAPVPTPPAPVAHRAQARTQLGVKPQPRHGGPDLVTIPKDGQLLDTGKRVDGWADVFYGAHGKAYWGWVPGAQIEAR